MPKKLTYELVKSYFEKDGYIPKFTEYINSITKLDYICPNGHRHSISWNKWSQSKRCPHCAGNGKPKFADIIASFEKYYYVLLSQQYINSKSKLDFICPNGHDHSISWNNWQKGERCGKCNNWGLLSYKLIMHSFELADYELVSKEYINSATKLCCICPNGHEYKVTWDNWKQGQRCYRCNDNNTSKFEQEVKDYILSLHQVIIENDRTTILNPNTNKYLELDILFPCKTKAIECNGVYWHSLPKAIEKDKIKQKQCKDKNIKLLTILDTDWISNKEKQKLKIKRFINNG